jgi:hypothetical protein
MRRRLILAAIPFGLALPFLFGGRWGAKPPIQAGNQATPIQADNQASVEQSLDFHLFTPTFLPRGMVRGHSGIRRGVNRVLCDYSNEADTLIIAEEKRNPDRDAYNHRRFAGRSLDVNGNEGSLTTGELGEQRVTFYTPDVTVVISSATLSEQELVTVARSMR